MCGICGVFQVEGGLREPIALETLDRMTDVMTHRGPNDRGVYLEPGAALGARRLSIVDVAGGHQPVCDERRRIWAVHNGELYNHRDVRDTLAPDGHAFASDCDTEIIPHLYERHGPAFPEQLRGMFGIALWDEERRCGVLVRDRLGIKPLYYARVGDLLVFGSELKSVLASGVIPETLDYEAIDAFLTFGFFPGPSTPLASVSKLMPGHTLVVENGHVRIERYWEHPRPEPTAAPAAELGERLLEGLRESVRLRLMSDVPLGAMLSGGIDSSLIVALMAEQMDEPVKTFSVGFAGAAEGNELADARAVAEALGTEHHELELSLTDDRVDLADLVWYLDEPLADLSAIGFIALCELAAEHVTVALSGQGADELLGGYRKHQAAALAGRWQRLPQPIRSVGLRVAAHGPRRIRRATRTLAARDTAERLVAMSGKLDASVRGRLFRGRLAELDGEAARRAVLARLNGTPDDPLPVTLYVDAQLALVDDMLHYFDRASMAHSLEVRVPFLDHKLVEFCATIPPELKVRGMTTKYLLKKVARGVIPDRVIDRPKVGFFNAAVDAWFQAQARGAIKEFLLAPEPRYAQLLDPTEVCGLVDRHAHIPSKRDGQLLLSILMLELWLATYLPRARAAESRSPAPVAG
jgi:asparagine synthase (glutamine-hydrolysing)